jgi:hypothetical protein
LTLGFNTTLEHKEPFYRHLPQYPGKPQYPSGPWLTGISGVYHAVITISLTSTASKNLFFYQLPVLLPLFYLHPLSQSHVSKISCARFFLQLWLCNKYTLNYFVQLPSSKLDL